MQMLSNGSISVSIQCVVLLIPFRLFGAFIITMWGMLCNDVLPFVCIWLTFAVGFTLALLRTQSAQLRMLMAQAPGAYLALVGTPKWKAEFGLRRSMPRQLSASKHGAG